MKNLWALHTNSKKVKNFPQLRSRKCALCRHEFEGPSKYSLFCEDCKEHNDRYRFAEWLSDSTEFISI